MNDAELLRYSRHILLPDFDVAGQERLRASHVLVLGLGGLGSPAAMYLAAAGVGQLTLADGDRVELGNLQRQIAHRTADIGHQKTASAARCLSALNPTVRIKELSETLCADALQAAVSAADLTIDASDNFATRYALNRAAISARTPLVSGAAIRAEGQLAVFDFRRAIGPCYHCLYPTPTSSASVAAARCADSGVLAPVPGIIGSLQALEAIKLLTDYGSSLHGRLLLLDGGVGHWRELCIPADPNCPVCASAWKS